MKALLKILLLIVPALVSWLPALGEEIKASLLTFYPGNEIYELDGHTALRLSGPGIGDTAYNWGTFDFNTPNFVYRFVKGETDYVLAAAPAEMFIDYYRSCNRRVVEQELNLTPVQAARLVELVTENMRPENRTYRYNYVLDNCATRPLDIIEKAVGQPLVTNADIAPTDTTFRAAMTRNHANYPWYQFGIDLALGSGLDREISVRERTFAPVNLMEYLATVNVRDSATGTDRPLVKSTRVPVNVAPDAALEKPTAPWLTPKFWSWLVFALTVLVSWRNIIRGRSSRWFDSLLFGSFTLAGLLLSFLIFVSVHEATSPNWLYLWLNPLCLVGAAGPWIKSARKLVFYWQFLNFALVFALGVAAIAGIQHLNAAFWPLMLSAQMRNITNIHCYKCAKHQNQTH